jgi:hypothetical protein
MAEVTASSEEFCVDVSLSTGVTIVVRVDHHVSMSISSGCGLRCLAGGRASMTRWHARGRGSSFGWHAAWLLVGLASHRSA